MSRVSGSVYALSSTRTASVRRNGRTIGDGSAFGGRAGVADHVIIGEGAQIGAGAGVFRDVAPKAVMGGYPSLPMRQWLREVAWLSKAAAVRRREEPDQ